MKTKHMCIIFCLSMYGCTEGRDVEKNNVDSGVAVDVVECFEGCLLENEQGKYCDVECESKIKCIDLVDVFCGYISESCETGFNSCKNDIQDIFGCTNAVDFTDTSCAQDMERFTCGDEFPLSCFGVVGVGEEIDRLPLNCESMVADMTCRDDQLFCELNQCDKNETPVCGEPWEKPTCVCRSGYIEDSDGNCIPTCEETARQNAGRCEDQYGPNWVESCEGREVTDRFWCVCDEGYVSIDSVVGPEDGDRVCVLDRCDEYLQYVWCSDGEGNLDPNCECECESMSDVACYCVEGYSSPGSGACAPNMTSGGGQGGGNENSFCDGFDACVQQRMIGYNSNQASCNDFDQLYDFFHQCAVQNPCGGSATACDVCVDGGGICSQFSAAYQRCAAATQNEYNQCRNSCRYSYWCGDGPYTTTCGSGLAGGSVATCY